METPGLGEPGPRVGNSETRTATRVRRNRSMSRRRRQLHNPRPPCESKRGHDHINIVQVSETVKQPVDVNLPQEKYMSSGRPGKTRRFSNEPAPPRRFHGSDNRLEATPRSARSPFRSPNGLTKVLPRFDGRRTSSADAVVAWPSIDRIAGRLRNAGRRRLSANTPLSDSTPVIRELRRPSPFLGIDSQRLRRVEPSPAVTGRTVFVPTGSVPVVTYLTTKS